MAAVTDHLRAFVHGVRDSVVADRTVAVRGAGTRMLLDHERSGRSADDVVTAPVGILDFQPDEMIVRCGAGTRLDDLRALLDQASQTLNVSGHGSIGGALARGWDDVHRLGRGRLRDVVLEMLVVDHRGRLLRLGGPTVKNVTGFDLARVQVGALGTLGFLGEVTLRTRPRPLASQWIVIDDVDRSRLAHLQRTLYRPTSLLWNGSRLWVHLEGHPRDIDETILAVSASEAEPPSLPPHRWSMPPSDGVTIPLEPGDVLEVGVGLLHRRQPAPVRPVPALAIHRRLDDEFNPDGRLNPQVVPFGSRAGS